MPPGGQRGGLHTVGNYTLLEVVGQGTFGEVWSAVERHTRESVAVKILEKDKITDDDARQRLVNEIAILQRVQHGNLVQLLEVIEEVDRIYLVTEYVGGGELFSYIVQKGRLDEVEASRLFGQMMAAVDSCHRQLVIHRDLKPENVLLDSNGDIKVIDFGLGTLLNYADEVLTVACGSPHYAAPEMLLGGGYLGQRADMWSLGVCLYAMVCGCLPFDEPEMEVLYDRIIAGEYDFSPNPSLSHHCKDLICGLLCSPPEERLSAREVLAHKWMRHADVPSRSAASQLSLGLVGAVVDPACKMLSRKMEAEYGLPQREVVEALRRGERSPLTATYWLLRQRELRKGNIQRFAAHLPRPPPPRAPSQRRRPVPSHIRAAAAKLPAVAAAQSPPTPPSLNPNSSRNAPWGPHAGGGGSGGDRGGYDPIGSERVHAAALRHAAADSPFSSAASSPYGGGSSGAPSPLQQQPQQQQQQRRSNDGGVTQRGGGRYDDGGKGGGGIGGIGGSSLVHRQREEAPLYVHASGALTDRTDRDGHSRRLHELEAGPVRRAGGAQGSCGSPHTRAPACVGAAYVGATRESHITQITDLTVTGNGRSPAGAADRHGGPPSARVASGGAGYIADKLGSLGFGTRGGSAGKSGSHSSPRDSPGNRRR